MTWELQWSWVARHRDLFTLDWAAAERIDAALLRLSDTGRGPIERAEGNIHRLRVKGAVALLFIDGNARTILVKRIYRGA